VQTNRSDKGFWLLEAPYRREWKMKKLVYALALCLIAFGQTAIAEELGADKILRYNEATRKMAFKLLITDRGIGEVCGEVLRVMLLGSSKDKEKSDFWSVECSGGREYLVVLERGADDAYTVNTCKQVAANHALLSALAGVRPKGDVGCWIRFKD
jgi:hypothetical protein